MTWTLLRCTQFKRKRAAQSEERERNKMMRTERKEDQMEQKKIRQELNQEEAEKVSAGSWLGNIFNKIKSFGD